MLDLNNNILGYIEIYNILFFFLSVRAVEEPSLCPVSRTQIIRATSQPITIKLKRTFPWNGCYQYPAS